MVLVVSNLQIDTMVHEAEFPVLFQTDWRKMKELKKQRNKPNFMEVPLDVCKVPGTDVIVSV